MSGLEEPLHTKHLRATFSCEHSKVFRQTLNFGHGSAVYCNILLMCKQRSSKTMSLVVFLAIKYSGLRKLSSTKRAKYQVSKYHISFFFVCQRFFFFRDRINTSPVCCLALEIVKVNAVVIIHSLPTDLYINVCVVCLGIHTP